MYPPRSVLVAPVLESCRRDVGPRAGTLPRCERSLWYRTGVIPRSSGSLYTPIVLNGCIRSLQNLAPIPISLR
ncbi:hypothetical protein DY000_02039908 [Brassica cretica]|uniref:Uncharacterized protein n=1 Tax=Brassica cretica TaxID=69181 RepID=A0ABQ7BAR7_BRACR|nr:hypothetical protein DY000_02039908 [Brassica cretica]